MAETEAPLDPSAQSTIEMPNGIVLTGVGGDVEAIRETFEERQEEKAPAPKAPVAAAPEPPATGEPKPKPARKRIDQLTFEREEATRRADTAEARIKELEAASKPPVAAAVPQVVPPVVAAEIKPTRPEPTEEEVGTKYTTYSAFVKDLAAWTVEQERAKLFADLDARSSARIEADQASRTRMDYVNTTVFPAGRAAYTDFDAVLASNKTMTPGIVHEAILKLPNPEHALYALAKDNAKLEGIIALAGDPLKLGIAVAQLMPRESVAPPASTAPVVRTTNAPAPIQPVGAGTRTTSPTLEELAQQGNYEGYKAARAAQRAS